MGVAKMVVTLVVLVLVMVDALAVTVELEVQAVPVVELVQLSELLAIGLAQ